VSATWILSGTRSTVGPYRTGTWYCTVVEKVGSRLYELSNVLEYMIKISSRMRTLITLTCVRVCQCGRSVVDQPLYEVRSPTPSTVLRVRGTSKTGSTWYQVGPTGSTRRVKSSKKLAMQKKRGKVGIRHLAAWLVVQHITSCTLGT